jgi:hypothetical protein
MEVVLQGFKEIMFQCHDSSHASTKGW